MDRYKIATGKYSREDEELNRYMIKNNNCISFVSAVDMSDFMSVESDEWEPFTATPLIIGYMNTKGTKSVLISSYNWNKTKHFLPVSFTMNIEKRETFIIAKNNV